MHLMNYTIGQMKTEYGLEEYNGGKMKKEAVDKITRIDKNNFLLTCSDGWFEIWTCPIPDTNEPNKTPNYTHIRLQGQEVMGNIELHTFVVSGYGIHQKAIHLDSVVEFCALPVKQSLIGDIDEEGENEKEGYK